MRDIAERRLAARRGRRLKHYRNAWFRRQHLQVCLKGPTSRTLSFGSPLEGWSAPWAQRYFIHHWELRRLSPANQRQANQLGTATARASSQIQPTPGTLKPSP